MHAQPMVTAYRSSQDQGLCATESVAPLPEALVCHQMAYTKQDSCWTCEHLVQIECHLAFKVRLIMAM